MASVTDLVQSMEQALARSREAQAAAVEAMAAAAARIKATGVRVTSEETPSGVRVRFAENQRSRAQVRFNPADVATKAAERISDQAQQAMQQVVSR